MHGLLNSRPNAEFILTSDVGVFHYGTQAEAKRHARQLRRAGLSAVVTRVQHRSVHTDMRFRYEPPPRLPARS